MKYEYALFINWSFHYSIGSESWIVFLFYFVYFFDIPVIFIPMKTNVFILILQ